MSMETVKIKKNRLLTDVGESERKNAENDADRQRKSRLPITDGVAENKYHKWLNKDPFPEISPALLNSADIFEYVAETGMIYPFNIEKLSGASYEVAIGGPVIWWDEEKQEMHEEDLSKPGSAFRLEPNSIAFVTLEPTFRIPDYLALRFNLKILHVYKGLLLGTGPLVDPGFVGKLSIPLHNLTANTYTFRHGEGIIELEFTKLSPNGEWLRSNTSEGEERLYKRKWIKPGRTLKDYIDRALLGSSGIMVKSAIPNNLKGIRDVAEKTQKNVDETKKEVDQRFRGIQLITFLSLVPVLAFACTAIYQIGSAYTTKLNQVTDLQKQYEDQVSDLQKQYEKQAADLQQQYEGQAADLQKQYEELDNKYTELEKRLEEMLEEKSEKMEEGKIDDTQED